MNDFAKMAVSGGLALNQRLAKAAANGVDWVFKRDTLIQSGRTWFELVHDGDLMAVRYYGLPEESEIELVDGSTKPIERHQHDIPLVLVPPLGVSTETFDLMPQRSLVRFMAACGFKTYLVDWGKPKKEHAHLNLKDYSYTMLGAALEKIRAHSGSEEVSMMGWCMGGLLMLLHQGQVQDPRIRNIITVASPIDLESGRGAIAGLAGAALNLDGPAKLVSNYTNLRLKALDPARLAMPPWLTTLVFKLTDPVGSVTTYWDLVTGLSDREYVKSYSTTANYLNNMLLYPGGVLQDMAVKVAGENQLAKGRVEVGDNVAELDAIESNLLAFAGKTDILVPAGIAEKIVDIVASKDKEFRLAPGGHMGVIIGSKAQSAVWAESVEWLAQRSSHTKPKPKPKPKPKARRRPVRKAATKASVAVGKRKVRRKPGAVNAKAG
tara:strand:- start:105145 stop:106452 length:1308 start_codon:yes stop_codon:yes gene_type:complete